MPLQYRPLARPSEFYYVGGYMFTTLGLMLVGFGVVRLDWQYFAFALPSLTFAVLTLASLAWWRRRYDTLNPEDVDTEISRLERISDEASTWLIQSVARAFKTAVRR